MATTKTDLRAQRTDKAIRQAFEEMLMTGATPIKVSALTQRAGINRKTFYLHYDTIEDLVDSYISDARADLLGRLGQHTPQEFLANRGLLINTLTDFFTANQEFYSYIMFADEYTALIRRFQDDITRTLAKSLSEATDLTFDDAALVITFSCSTILTMLRMRLRGQTKMTPEEIREKSVALNIGGLRGAMGLDV
jgi:AcrR family transcriptional regulator